MKLFYTILAVAFIAGSFIEYWVSRREDKQYYSFRDMGSSIRLMLAGLAVDLVIKTGAIYLLVKLSAIALFPMQYQWWAWLLCYLVWDLIFYIKHYMEHNVRFMWAIHVNHHSSPYLNLSTSLRSGVFKSGYRYFFWAALIFIGFPVPMFLVLYGLGKVWAFFGHSQKLGKWGVFEKFTVTPTHHQLHHSCNENNLNKNFGETFLFWDKLFGTFKETHEPLVYGISDPVNHDDFKEVVFHEFRSIRNDLRTAVSWRDRLKIIFGRPGSYKPSNTAV